MTDVIFDRRSIEFYIINFYVPPCADDGGKLSFERTNFFLLIRDVSGFLLIDAAAMTVAYYYLYAIALIKAIELSV